MKRNASSLRKLCASKKGGRDRNHIIQSDFWSGHFNVDSSTYSLGDATTGDSSRRKTNQCVSRRSVTMSGSSMITIDEDKEQRNPTNKYHKDNKKHDNDCDNSTSSNSSSSTNNKILDFDREVVRMEALEVYILVSTLTSIAALTSIESLRPPNNNTKPRDREYWEAQMFYMSTLFVSTISGLSGLYAAGIFSLCVLYGKTSLGLSRDPMYRLFIARTAKFRARGFRAFSISLLCFSLQILIITISKVPKHDFIRIPIFLAVFTLTFVVFHDWKTIIMIATPIFTNVLPEEYQNEENDEYDDESGSIIRRKSKEHQILNIGDYINNTVIDEKVEDCLGTSES